MSGFKTKNDPILLVNRINHLAAAIQHGRRHQRLVIVNRLDVGDVQGKEPGQARSDAKSDNPANDKQETDDMVMVHRPLAGGPFRSFFASVFSGWHEKLYRFGL